MANRTFDIDQKKLDDIKRQLSTGAELIDVGRPGKLKADSPILKRMLTSPRDVAFLRTDQTPNRPDVPTPTLPPGQQINIAPGTTGGQFDMALQNIMQSRVQKSNQPYISGGSAAMQGLMTLPEQLSSTEGWGGLNLSQARRLEQMEQGGLSSMYEGFAGALEQKQTRLKELRDTAVKAFEEQRVIEAETEGLNKELIGMETSLRKEFQASSKDFESIRDSYGRIKASVVDPSPAGDLSLIFNYMKLLDPNSVVRESEFATAQNAGTIPESIRGMYNRLIEGSGRLDSDLRKDFVDRANKLYGAQFEQHDKRIAEFTRIAKNSGLDPANVIMDLTAIEGVAETTDTADNLFYAKGTDGQYYPYDLTNSADVAELDQGRQDGFFTN